MAIIDIKSPPAWDMDDTADKVFLHKCFPLHGGVMVDKCASSG